MTKSRGSVQEVRGTTAAADPGLLRNSPAPVPARLFEGGPTGGAVDRPAVGAVVPLVEERGLEPIGGGRSQAHFTLLDDHWSQLTPGSGAEASEKMRSRFIS